MTRRGILAGIFTLAATGGALAAPPRLTVPDASPVEEVQGRGHGRRRRCWWETRRVRYRDAWGRIRERHVRHQVCNF
ncbi:hypothetical protein [Sediminicoccus sp. KRV36]|uniref:hypothetical protein n=1 Tax=Sediminicoccus sp. KRV36 TaxID=3133721 RepID=UPI0020107360|nr:hypothetical protein [Sediminicoccus rosea]UPY38416.1 hypothetical protein LHU95_06900 [Sediminicoccus rosea]